MSAVLGSFSIPFCALENCMMTNCWGEKQYSGLSQLSQTAVSNVDKT